VPEGRPQRPIAGFLPCSKREEDRDGVAPARKDHRPLVATADDLEAGSRQDDVHVPAFRGREGEGEPALRCRLATGDRGSRRDELFRERDLDGEFRLGKDRVRSLHRREAFHRDRGLGPRRRFHRTFHRGRCLVLRRGAASAVAGPQPVPILRLALRLVLGVLAIAAARSRFPRGLLLLPPLGRSAAVRLRRTVSSGRRGGWGHGPRHRGRRCAGPVGLGPRRGWRGRGGRVLGRRRLGLQAGGGREGRGADEGEPGGNLFPHSQPPGSQGRDMGGIGGRFVTQRGLTSE
jgi:hypothetical protein